MSTQFKDRKDRLVAAVLSINSSMLPPDDRDIMRGLFTVPDDIDGVQSVESLLSWSHTLHGIAGLLGRTADRSVTDQMIAQSLAVHAASHAYRLAQTPMTALHVAHRINEYVHLLNATDNVDAALDLTRRVTDFIREFLSSAAMQGSDEDASLALRCEMGRALVQRAVVLEKSGSIDDALACANEAVEAYQAPVSSTSHRTPDVFRAYAAALHLAGRLAERAGRLDLALERYQGALRSNVDAYGTDHAETRAAQTDVTRVRHALVRPRGDARAHDADAQPTDGVHSVAIGHRSVRASR